MVITMAILRMAHASTHGARKPPEPIFFFLHISFSFAKIFRETNFHAREIPQSGSKAEDGKKEKRKKERTMVITMAKLRMAHASMHGVRKPPGPKRSDIIGLKPVVPYLSFCDPEYI